MVKAGHKATATCRQVWPDRAAPGVCGGKDDKDQDLHDNSDAAPFTQGAYSGHPRQSILPEPPYAAVLQNASTSTTPGGCSRCGEVTRTDVSSASMPQTPLLCRLAMPMPLAPPPAACHATRSICVHVKKVTMATSAMFNSTALCCYSCPGCRRVYKHSACTHWRSAGCRGSCAIDEKEIVRTSHGNRLPKMAPTIWTAQGAQVSTCIMGDNRELHCNTNHSKLRRKVQINDDETCAIQ
jgi:hypothetical protein